jgi:hypothetical protein
VGAKNVGVPVAWPDTPSATTVVASNAMTAILSSRINHSVFGHVSIQ